MSKPNKGTTLPKADVATVLVGSNDAPKQQAPTPVSVTTAVSKFDATPSGFKVVHKGDLITRADGTQYNAKSDMFTLQKADTFQGADGEAKEAARKQAGLDRKAEFAPVEAALNQDSSFILTKVTIATAKKSKARKITTVKQEVRALTLADMLATDRGGTPEYWDALIKKGSAEVDAEKQKLLTAAK